MTKPPRRRLGEINAANIGALNQPASGSVTVDMERLGPLVLLTFTFTAAQIPVTDGTTSGSYGSLKIFDFIEQALGYLGCRQNYTAFAEGAALTGAAGDAVFEIGLGTNPITAAADGALGADEDDVGGDINVTLSGGTATGTGTNTSTAAADGTGTAADLYLNWSGTAATIDASSTIDVTGTATVGLLFLGDD